MSRCGAVTKTTSEILAVLLDMSNSFALVAFDVHREFLVCFERSDSQVRRERAFDYGGRGLESGDAGVENYCEGSLFFVFLLLEIMFANVFLTLVINAFDDGFRGKFAYY